MQLEASSKYQSIKYLPLIHHKSLNDACVILCSLVFVYSYQLIIVDYGTHKHIQSIRVNAQK